MVTRASILANTDPRYGCTNTRLKTCMFFTAVGSTIRRCTKLYALSRLPWALERTAPTGWHARFDSPMLTTHFALFPVGFFLTSTPVHSHPHLSTGCHHPAWPSGLCCTGQRMTTVRSRGTKTRAYLGQDYQQTITDNLIFLKQHSEHFYSIIHLVF